MESNRQKKIAGILQKDMVDVLQGAASKSGLQGTIMSVTKVSVTPDLSIAKIYLSIFPNTNASEIFKEIQSGKSRIRHEMAQRTRHQLRRMPELEFFIDDSLEYIDKIEKSLKGLDDPIENPDLLDKRKKS